MTRQKASSLSSSSSSPPDWLTLLDCIQSRQAYLAPIGQSSACVPNTKSALERLASNKPTVVLCETEQPISCGAHSTKVKRQGDTTTNATTALVLSPKPEGPLSMLVRRHVRRIGSHARERTRASGCRLGLLRPAGRSVCSSSYCNSKKEAPPSKQKSVRMKWDADEPETDRQTHNTSNQPDGFFLGDTCRLPLLRPLPPWPNRTGRLRPGGLGQPEAPFLIFRERWLGRPREIERGGRQTLSLSG